MGMFDTVYFNCPSCKARIEVQSKAGHCKLGTYKSRSVPPEIARDIHGKTVYCDCGKMIEIRAIEPIRTVEMYAREVGSDDDFVD